MSHTKDSQAGPSSSSAAPTPSSSVPPACTTIYCQVCTLPPSYCALGLTQARCKSWLLASHPTLHEKLYSAEAVNQSLAGLSLEMRERAEKDLRKKAAKAQAADEKAAEAKAKSVVHIRRLERNKRKFVTAVQGMDVHGLELKKVAKEFGKKFACGSSVTKRTDGQGDEIVVQGDLAYEIEDEIVERYKMIPEDNIVIVDEKKKKAG